MLETSARLLRLLSLLQTPRDWTGAELAERLAVSTRTVRHDVERLRSLGYPVHGTRGAAGGYRLGAGASLPPLLLEDDEAVAVAIGLRTAAGSATTGIEESSLRALTKLEQVLPFRLRRRVTALHAFTVPVRGERESGFPSVEPDLLSMLAGACRDREQVRFDYRDHDGTSTRRTAEPHRLVNWGRRWYLVAWDIDRRDWRTFRVDRIASCEGTGLRSEPRELPEEDVARYVSRRVAGAAWRYRTRVTVRAPAESVAARISVVVGSVEAIDEHSCVLVTGAESVETLAVYLGMLGVDFTVTEPPELLDYLRELGRRYAAAAGG